MLGSGEGPEREQPALNPGDRDRDTGRSGRRCSWRDTALWRGLHACERRTHRDPGSRGGARGAQLANEQRAVAFRGELREDMAEFRAETRTSIAGLRTEMIEGFRQLDVRLRFLEEHLFLDQSAKQASA